MLNISDNLHRVEDYHHSNRQGNELDLELFSRSNKTGKIFRCLCRYEYLDAGIKPENQILAQTDSLTHDMGPAHGSLLYCRVKRDPEAYRDLS